MSWDRLDPYEHRFPDEERNCSECAHSINGKCELWECWFEEKDEMTLTRALKIGETVEIDYSGMDEKEVGEMDEAIDMIFSFARRWLEERTSIRKPYEKNEFGVVKKWQCRWCAEIMETRFWKYCPNCGRKLISEGEEV